MTLANWQKFILPEEIDKPNNRPNKHNFIDIEFKLFNFPLINHTFFKIDLRSKNIILSAFMIKIMDVFQT